MKTIYTLTSTLLIALSMSASAKDHSSDKPKSMVAVSPFVWGSPAESVPEEIKLLKAKFALVPIAPFVWGNAGETAPKVVEERIFMKLEVPVAPFVWGNPNEIAPILEVNIETELL
jgi:hypothetical protein